VTLTGCQPTTSDADGSIISTDLFSGVLTDPNGGTNGCGTDHAGQEYTLDGSGELINVLRSCQDISITFTCPGVITGQIAEGSWSFITMDQDAELSDIVSFTMTHSSTSHSGLSRRRRRDRLHQSQQQLQMSAFCPFPTTACKVAESPMSFEVRLLVTTSSGKANIRSASILSGN
jgi:hypothetical protein